MEQGLITYIKNMFSMDATPEWAAGYEGLIFYDKSARKWVIGNNEGWQVIDRKSTVVSSDITRTKWIDAFEYPTDSSVRSNYIVTGSGIELYSDATETTYGDYSLKGVATVSGSLDSFIERTLNNLVNLTDEDYLKFDIRSSVEGSSINFSMGAPYAEYLDNWANRIKFTIPAEKIDEDLTHFPVNISLNSEMSEVFNELEYVKRPTSVDDDFTGTNGDLPNTDLWHDMEDDHYKVEIEDNRLVMEALDDDSTSKNIFSKFIIEGNFDIQIDVDANASSESSATVGWLRVSSKESAGTYAFIGLSYLTGGTLVWDRVQAPGTSCCNDNSAAITTRTGTVRIVREGSNLTTYYMVDATSFTALTTDELFCDHSVEVVLTIYRSDTSYTLKSYFDNFKVNAGTIVWPVLEDYFTGDDGDIPNEILWSYTATNTEYPEVYDNKLRMDIAVSALDIWSRIVSNFNINSISDFDIQIDYDIVSSTAPSSSTSYLAFFQFNAVSGAMVRIGVIQTTSYTKFQVYDAISGSTEIICSYLTGKFRIIKTTTAIKGYYWSGTQWEWDGSTSGYTFGETFGDTFNISIYSSADYGAGVVCDFDNFIVNSGTIVWPNGHPNRKKIAVTKEDGVSQLYCEIENWNNEEAANLWVSKSDWLISSSKDTDLYLYYDKAQEDNSDYIGDVTDSAALHVWNSDADFVYTMSQDPTGTIKDSTTNAFNATSEGTMLSSNLVDGLNGKAIEFDGVDDCLRLPSYATFGDGKTLTFMFKADSLNTYQIISNSTGHAYGRLSINISNIDIQSGNDTSTEMFHLAHMADITEYHVYTLIQNDTTVTLYVDGALTSSQTNTNIDFNTFSFDNLFGKDFTTAWNFVDGIVTHFEVVDGIKSDSWIKALSSSLRGSLLTYNAVESRKELISKDINIYNKDTFQTELIDISAVSGSAETIKFTIMDDILENTFYIDNMSFGLPFVGTKGLYNWIDPFEYETDTKLNSTYTTVGSGISVSTDVASKTYGYRSMKLDTSTAEVGSYVIREFSPPLSTPADYISFDVMSDTISSGIVVQFINSANTVGVDVDFENYNPTITETINTSVYTAKSVIFDIADNWGGNYIGIRSIDFYSKGSLIEMTASDFTAYATTVFSTNYSANYPFDTSLSKTGTQIGNEWVGADGYGNAQRLIVVFNTAVEFDTIVINNGHHIGAGTAEGAKNTKIYTSSDEITDTTYDATISNSELIFYGQIDEHIESDVEDPQTLEFLPENYYMAKSVVLDIADNWGHSSYIGIRSVDFYLDGNLVELDTTDFTVYYTSQLVSSYPATAVFKTSLSKTGAWEINQWLSSSAIPQRLSCVFNSEIIFDSIVINNSHASGANTPTGAKNVKIYVSSDTISDNTYGAEVTNSTVIFDDQFNEHVAASDVEDPQELTLSGFEVVEEWGIPFNHIIDIKNLYTYQKEALFITEPSISGSIDYMKIIVTEPGPIYNIDNMRFDSDQETYWLDVCEYTTSAEILDVYETSNSSIVPSVSTNYKSYGEKSIKLTTDTTASGNSFIRPFAAFEDAPHTAKSVILDFTDNYGDNSYMGIRQCDFYYEGSKIELTVTTDFVAYSTSNYSSTPAQWAFDTSTDYLGDYTGEGWMSNNASTNQRLIIVFNTEQTFDSIVINNNHGTSAAGGSNLIRGVKNILIYISTDEITDTTYGTSITNSNLIFNNQIAIHADGNVQDDQVLDITLAGGDSVFVTGRIPPTNTILFDLASNRLGENIECSLDYFPPPPEASNPYLAKSVIIDIADNWGSTMMGLRQCDFYYQGNRVVLGELDFTAYATGFYNASFVPKYAFNTVSTVYDGDAASDSWMVYATSEQRLIAVFNAPITFDTVVINNYHNTGALVDRGVKNIKIYVSGLEVTSTVYGEAIEESSCIFDGEIATHSATDTAEDQVLETTASGSYYVCPCDESFTIGTENPTSLGGAFDGVTDSQYAAGSWYAHNGTTYTVTGWTGQDFGAGNEQIITKLDMLVVFTNATYPPKNWTFEASSTGAWGGEEVVLYTKTDDSFTTSVWNTYSFENDTAYRYYRVNVSEANGSSAYLVISEIKMYTTYTLANEIEELTTTVPINTIALNKFRTYSIDVSEAEYINKLQFTITNSDYDTNYYLDNMRFY
jgi:hypothetical protein